MPSLSTAPFRNSREVTVSVVVVSHNYGHFLERFIRSVAEQTLSDWELVIVDDGSDDDTLDIARRCLTLCGEQQVTILTAPHSGVSRARNLGIALARGKYVSCPDASGWYYPSALELMLKEIEDDPSLTVVSSPVQAAGPDGGKRENLPYAFQMLSGRSLITSSAMFRRDAWQKVGGYDEGMIGYEDWDFWVTLGEAGYSMKCLDEILWHDRVSQDGKCDTKLDSRDLELRARIVCNHPGIYRDCCRRLAEQVASADVTDAEILSCPHLIFSGSFRAEAAMQRAERSDLGIERKDDESSETLMAQPCLVPFQHCSQRAGLISWAQQFVWEWISQGLAEGRSTNYDLCFSMDVPAGTTTDNFLTAISRMVSRHESLRTRFERSGRRLVRQEAIGSGYADVIRYRVRGGRLPTDELLRSHVSGAMLDFENSYPFRAGFVAAAGVVTHAAFTVSKIIADAGGCDNVISSLLSELSALRSGASARPEPVFQQLDEVAWENSADGLRAERQALDYWREQMAVIRELPRPAVIDSGIMRSGVVPAASVLTAADEVARTSGASSSAVILTAFLQAAAQTLRMDGLGCFLHCSNRTDLTHRGSITRLRNMGVYAYTPGDPDFRSAVREVFRDSLKAYRNARSPGGLFLSRFGAAPEDGPFIEFNDVRSVVVDRPADLSQQSDPRTAAEPGEPKTIEVRPLDSQHPEGLLMLSVGPFVGGPPEVLGMPVLRLETNVLCMDDISLLLTRMDRILTAAVMGSPAGQPELAK